jgi:hypothetical protein
VSRELLETSLPAGRRDAATLARCIGEPGAFLADTWGARAAVFAGVDALGYADLLALDDVDRILTTTSIRTPAFRLVRSDRAIAETEYTRSGTTGSRPVAGMADPAKVAALFEDGATIVLQGLHRYAEPVAAFVRGLELELGQPCQVNAYITPPRAKGLALHVDPHDVFVLQAFGRKRWEVHAAPGEAQRAPLEPVLGPGDCLYLPAGTPHAAAAQESVSGHLTVGVHVTAWRDVLEDAWKLAAGDPAFDEPVPSGWTRDPEGFARLVRERLAVLRSRLGSIDAGEVAERRIERFLSTRPPLLRGAVADRLAVATIDDDSELRRRRDSVCELRLRDDTLVALLGDRRLEMPRWLEPAMRRVAASSSVRARDLADEVPDPGSRLVLVRRLVREGLLTPAR